MCCFKPVPPPPPPPTCRALTGCGLVCSGLPGDLAQLRNLQTLDLAHNLISGGVPDDWVAPGAFAELQTLQLGALPARACSPPAPPAAAADRYAAWFHHHPAPLPACLPHPCPPPAANNSLAGALGDFNPTAGGFIASLYFNVSRNQFSQGSIPSSWYSRTLALIDISYNDVSGGCSQRA